MKITKSMLSTFVRAEAEVDALKAKLKVAEARKANAEAAIRDAINAGIAAGEVVAVPRKGKNGNDYTVRAGGYVVNDYRFSKFAFSREKLEAAHPGAYEAAKDWGKPQSSLTVKPE